MRIGPWRPSPHPHPPLSSRRSLSLWSDLPLDQLGIGDHVFPFTSKRADGLLLHIHWLIWLLIKRCLSRSNTHSNISLIRTGHVLTSCSWHKYYYRDFIRLRDDGRSGTRAIKGAKYRISNLTPTCSFCIILCRESDDELFPVYLTRHYAWLIKGCDTEKSLPFG